MKKMLIICLWILMGVIPRTDWDNFTDEQKLQLAFMVGQEFYENRVHEEICPSVQVRLEVFDNEVSVEAFCVGGGDDEMAL